MDARRGFRLGWLFVVLLGLTAVPTPADAPTILYRLGDRSEYQEGCFAPCMCPILLADELEGTFGLRVVGFDDPHVVYEVSNVDWTVPALGKQLAGSGTYRRGFGPWATQQLVLDLRATDGALQRYDSGIVPVQRPFPQIELFLSVNDFFCYDQVPFVSAGPSTSAPTVATEPGMISWSPLADATGYDVVFGDLDALQAGDFTNATAGCLADDTTGLSASHSVTPDPGDGVWFLVRGVGSAAGDTYDSNGPSQAFSRTADIEAAAASCP